MDLHPYLFCLSLCLLYFVLPPLEDNGLPFWVPDVLCQHSEVVLWNLLSVQMLFQWICGGESGLPILFLCHLRTTPVWAFLSGEAKFIETKSRMMVFRGLEKEMMRNCCLIGIEFQFGKLKKLWLLLPQQCKYIEHPWTWHLAMVKMVNFMLCSFYHNKK